MDEFILRSILKSEPNFTPSNSIERGAVEILISKKMVKAKRSETSGEFITLIVTEKGKRYLSTFD